jgi:hypothetical protein
MRLWLRAFLENDYFDCFTDSDIYSHLLEMKVPLERAGEKIEPLEFRRYEQGIRRTGGEISVDRSTDARGPEERKRSFAS